MIRAVNWRWSSVIPLTRPSPWRTPRRTTRAINHDAISTMSASTTSVIVTFVLVTKSLISPMSLCAGCTIALIVTVPLR